MRNAFLVFIAFLLCTRIAAAQVAPGVQQSAAHTANVTGSVTQSDGKPVAGATVRIGGPAVLSTSSNDRGIFTFNNVPWGTYRIDVTSAIGTAVKQDVVISGDITVAIQFEAPSAIKTIARVSTSSNGAHINVSSSSIASVTPSDYAFSGNATWTNLFAQVPGVAVSGYSSGGSAFAGTMRLAPQMPVVLSLNGALPYETSTTLDGMPLQGVSSNGFIENTGGGLDLSNLPMNAFDTADVVRGPGANAPSIVDSIGGSFVLHPPGPVNADHFELSVSNDPYGGIISNSRASFHFGKLSATIIYGINDSPGPLGSGTVIPALPFTPATIGGKPVALPPASQNLTVNGVPNCFCTVTSTLLMSGVQQSTNWSQQNGALALSYDVSRSISAEVFYAGTTSRQYSQQGYFPVEFAPQSGAGYHGSYAPSPAGQPTYTFPTQESAPSVVSQASSLLEEKVTAFVNGAVLRVAALQYNSFNNLSGPENYPNGQYRLWGTAELGSSSSYASSAYNGTLEKVTFPDESTQEYWWTNNRDLLLSYATQIGTSTSAGLSYTTSYYNAPYYANLTFDGTPVVNLTQSTAASSTTDETRVHVDSQVNDKLAIGLSWYFATGSFHVPTPSDPKNWSDSIFRYNAPRLGAVWRAGPNVAIRASAGGGFALPALPNLTGYALECSGGACTETTANLNLKPEETFGYDIGADARLERNTVASLDLYRTNLYGQFFVGTTQSTLNNQPLFINEYGNLGTSRMEGLNLTVNRDAPEGYYWRATLGLTHAYVMSVPGGFYNNGTCAATKACTNQSVVPGANFISNTYAATVPYSSASATLGYRWKPDRFVDLSSTYYGNNNIYNIPHAFVVLDAHAGYSFTNNVALLVNFNNITGAYDQSIQNFGTYGYVTPVVHGSTGYYPGVAIVQPYGPRYITVTANFKY